MECHKCGFKSDRQFVGAFNIFVRGLGVALSGAEVDDLLPNEPRGEPKLMKPKSAVGDGQTLKSVMRVDLNGRAFAHVPT